MVISLALVNGSHHEPIIKWFLPCSTSTPIITWLDLYLGMKEMKTLGHTILVQAVMEYS
jgi:hypothetical protein